MMFARLTAAALLAATATPALAQAGATETPVAVTKTEMSARLDTDYADLDANGDGKVDAAEIKARLKKGAEADLETIKKERDASFGRFDADKNGSISRAEFDARTKLPEIREATDADAKPVLDRFDANKDGNVTKEEFRAPTLANFEQLDKNKDGTLSVAEQQSPVAPARKTTVKETPPVGR
jgi:hypothetical protein